MKWRWDLVWVRHMLLVIGCYPKTTASCRLSTAADAEPSLRPQLAWGLKWAERLLRTLQLPETTTTNMSCPWGLAFLFLCDLIIQYYLIDIVLQEHFFSCISSFFFWLKRQRQYTQSWSWPCPCMSPGLLQPHTNIWAEAARLIQSFLGWGV